jgi:hypothetical protein
VTLKKGRGEHRKYRTPAFTEHGAIMAATILNSPRAEHMSVSLDADTRNQFEQVYEAILGLMNPAVKKQ